MSPLRFLFLVHTCISILVHLGIKAKASKDGKCNATVRCQETYCCSTYGYCGTTAEYCAPGFCQYQCPDPPFVPAITPPSTPGRTHPSTEPSTLGRTLPSSPNPKGGLSVVAEGVVAVLVVILILGAATYYYRRSNNAAMATSIETALHSGVDSERIPLRDLDNVGHQRGDSLQRVEGMQYTRVFFLNEVIKITNNFEQKIGEGGFGSVFKGRLDDGSEVAVKVSSAMSDDGQAQFNAEVSILSRLHHRNLVPLLGLCMDDNERILVYEFVDGGTLKDHLFSRGRNAPLNWPTRLRIAIDAARGLQYLHHDCDPKIIHRDVKSNNIMLDKNLRARVIDFGISKLLEDSKKEWWTTEVKGTKGYQDPEYEETGRLTFKSDVYAFGVVLLEIISGQFPRNIIFGDLDQLYPTLVGLFREMLSKDKLEELVDRKLGENYDMEAVQKVTNLAMMCLNRRSDDRPNMRQVVRELSETRESHGIWTRSGFQKAASSSNKLARYPSSNIQNEYPSSSAQS